jgi:putative transposase
MDERLKFVARLLDGEKMAVLCREFDISRKTGYKILTRYNDSGLEGLTDRSRRPYRHANQLPFQIEKLIVRLKQDKPTWGAPKIRERLARLYPDVHRRRSRRCMRFSTGMAWSSIACGGATGRRGRRFQTAIGPMICGAPITRVSSCSPIGAIAIR